MRPVLILLLALAASPSTAQPQYPVLFVHGLGSNDWTWHDAVVAFESEGWGPAYSMHFDLNATTSTLYSDDVRRTALVSFWDFPDLTPDGSVRAREADSFGLPRQVAPVAVDSEPADARAGASRLFVVNFENWHDASTNLMYVHEVRGAWGESDSYCSAVTKQAWALSKMIDAVVAATGAPRVILVGHSLGGLAIREYLQRTGAPAYRTPHGVAAVVMYGTPHLGAQPAGWPGGIYACGSLGGNEAFRDLYLDSNGGVSSVFLYSGSETWATGWHNGDVDTDGTSDDWIVGLDVAGVVGGVVRARDNPAVPLPLDVSYTYVRSTGDWVVPYDAQFLSQVDTDGVLRFAPLGVARGYTTDVGHTGQTRDVAVLREAILSATWTASEAVPGIEARAVEVSPNPTAGLAVATVTVPASGRARVVILDVLGREVDSYDLAGAPSTQASIQIDAQRWPAGVYVVRVDGQAGSARLTVAR